MERNTLTKGVYEIAHLTGEFKLRSGITSNEYFDKYQFESDPTLLKAIVAEMADQIPEGTELLAGLEMGGIAIATALSMHTGIPAVFVRKKAKEYGTCKLAEGPDVHGKRLLIVEDVITSGGQVIISSGELKEQGAIVENVACVIDREQGGKEALADKGLTMTSVFTMSELKAAGE